MNFSKAKIIFLIITNDAIFALLLAAAVRLACPNVWFYLNSASSIFI